MLFQYGFRALKEEKREGITLSILGKPNVGKSSLIEEISSKLGCVQPIIPSMRLKPYRAWIDRFVHPKLHHLSMRSQSL